MLSEMTESELHELHAGAETRYSAHVAAGLNLDLTRGKPATDQLDLANALDGLLQGDFRAEDGTDVRNYGGLMGLTELRRLGAAMLDTDPELTLAGGNSSLTLMFQFAEAAALFGLDGPGSAWRETLREVPDGGPRRLRFLCPVPGYDRHFTICERLAIEMIPVPLGATGPDPAELREFVRNDPNIRGIWCVPKYSNPTGIVYDDATVDAIAALPNDAGPGFRVFWDNAYAMHDFGAPLPLAPIAAAAEQHGTLEHIVQFASTSKITFAGGGVAFMSTGPATMAAFREHLAAMMIGPDKVNQLRHARLLPDLDSLRELMRRHADLIRPKFEVTLAALERLRPLGIATWSEPRGGYFISLDVQPGLASVIVDMAARAGVRLTPAGATWPLGREPMDRNLRLAPSYPTLGEVRQAMDVLVDTIILATTRQHFGLLAS